MISSCFAVHAKSTLVMVMRDDDMAAEMDALRVLARDGLAAPITHITFAQPLKGRDLAWLPELGAMFPAVDALCFVDGPESDVISHTLRLFGNITRLSMGSFADMPMASSEGYVPRLCNLECNADAAMSFRPHFACLTHLSVGYLEDRLGNELLPCLEVATQLQELKLTNYRANYKESLDGIRLLGALLARIPVGSLYLSCHCRRIPASAILDALLTELAHPANAVTHLTLGLTADDDVDTFLYARAIPQFAQSRIVALTLKIMTPREIEALALALPPWTTVLSLHICYRRIISPGDEEQCERATHIINQVIADNKQIAENTFILK